MSEAILETRTKQVSASSYSLYHEGLKQQLGINLRKSYEAIGLGEGMREMKTILTGE